MCPEGGGVSPDVVNDIREDGRLLGEVMTTNLRLRHEQRDDLAPVLLPRPDERVDAEVVRARADKLSSIEVGQWDNGTSEGQGRDGRA